VLDYAHNPAAVAGLMDFVHRLEARRRIGVITAPGDRRDEDLRALGRLCAGLDHVIVKEDENRRGRAEGAIASVIAEGLREGGLHSDRIEFILDEFEALDRAIAMLDDHDVAVALIDDVPGVIAHVRAAR
jgi:cyanophycin synthetase